MIRLRNRTLFLREAGLIVAWHEKQKAASTIFSETGTRAEDFKAVKNIKFTDINLQNVRAESLLADTVNGLRKIGLTARQKVSCRINEPHRSYVTVEYEFKNLIYRYVDSLSVGIYADWDFAGKPLTSGYDSLGKFAYVTDNQSYRAVKALGKDQSFYELSFSEISGEIDLRDGFSDAEKILAIKHGLHDFAENSSESRRAFTVGTKIREFYSTQNQSVAFIFAADTSLPALRKSFGEAENSLNKSASLSPLPLVPTEICDDGQLAIVPENGSKFRLYDAGDLTAPIAEGRTFSADYSDAGRKYYISCTDSLIESELLPYSFRIYKPEADFTAPEITDANDSTLVQFIESGSRAEHFIWDFGDGSPTSSERNPLHDFKEAGTYKIKLIVSDSLACFDSLSRTIRLIFPSQGPPPKVPKRLSGCLFDSLKLVPEKGSLFRFYTEMPGPGIKPFAEGRELILTDTLARRIFVTNADSVKESDFREVEILRSRLYPSFSASPVTDTVLFENITFQIDSFSHNFPLDSVLWDFGDSVFSKEVSPISSLFRAGNVSNFIDFVRFCRLHPECCFRLFGRPARTVPESSAGTNLPGRAGRHPAEKRHKVPILCLGKCRNPIF